MISKILPGMIGQVHAAAGLISSPPPPENRHHAHAPKNFLNYHALINQKVYPPINLITIMLSLPDVNA